MPAYAAFARILATVAVTAVRAEPAAAADEGFLTPADVKELNFNQLGRTKKMEGDDCLATGDGAGELWGHTADGRMVVKSEACFPGGFCGSAYMYYDKDCDGTGRLPNRWHAQQDPPTPTKTTCLVWPRKTCLLWLQKPCHLWPQKASLL